MTSSSAFPSAKICRACSPYFSCSRMRGKTPLSSQVWKNGVQSMYSRSVASGTSSSTRTPVNSGAGRSSARHSIGVRFARAAASVTSFCLGVP